MLRRRGHWIVLCCVLAAAAAFGLSKHQTKQYTATASLLFKSNQLTQQIAGLPSNITAQAQQNSNVRLVQVGEMAAKTASLLGLTERKVSDSLSVAQQGETSVVGESSVVNVSASAVSPTLAAEIANTYAEQFVKEQQTSNRQYFKSALTTVNKQLAALSPKQRLRGPGVTLQNRAQELKLLAELQYGGVQLAQSAVVPTSPSSPKTLRNTIIGGALGLLLGIGLVLLLERLDRRLREPEELETIYRAPLLGAVPRSASLSRSPQRTPDALLGLPPAEAEAFSLILAHLRSFNAERDIRTVLVTSAAPSDGTTTVALHLAEAATKSGARTLLLEMDLRRPTLAHNLCIQSGPGLSDVLTDTISMGEAAQSINLLTLAGGGTTGQTLDVLTSGVAQPSSPSELIKSHTMEAVLEQMKSTYDLVVIDTPSLMAVSDAFPILHKVDGVIVVSRIGHTRRDVAEQLQQVLDRSAAPLLGVVANHLHAKVRGTYAYDYAEGDKSSAAAASANGVVSSQETRSMTRI
ncbi:MAG TPA: GNVR domain-containing protein [Solirubrobacteraceae bacterium]|nr:GNVR domain-containing protein [Solirubrobacteraceae bacterium]